MNHQPLLTLAALVLAHLVADFVLQSATVAAEKFGSGPRAWRALVAHVAIVAVCLIPFPLVFGPPGAAVLLVVTISHGLIDRAKIVLTRRVEAASAAGAAARERLAWLGGPPAGPVGVAGLAGSPSPAAAAFPSSSVADPIGGGTAGGPSQTTVGWEAADAGLGPAWTPVPAFLFALDQLAHALVIVTAWSVFLYGAGLIAGAQSILDDLFRGTDRSLLGGWAIGAIVLACLAIVNVRAGSLFVSTLVRPIPTPNLDGPMRVGEAIGVLERIVIVTLVLGGVPVAIGFVLAAKTIARFRQLDDRAFAEYYLLGTLGSTGVALLSGLIAAAALGLPVVP